MGSMDLSKKIAIGLMALGVFAASLFFRSEISRFLSFGFKGAPGETRNLKDTSLGEEKSSQGFLDTPAVEPAGEDKSAIPATKTVSSKRPSAPPYVGRNPAEIRPVPEEVKLFTQTQLEQLYSTIKTHAKAVLADPKYFEGWIQVGILKKTIGDFEGARDAWEYAGVIEPLNSLSFANLGELYWRYLGQYQKAEENFRTSIKHKPDDVFNYVSLAELFHYSLKEKADQAPQVLLDGIAANPNDAGTLSRRLAYLYEQRQEFAKALEWWQKILEKNPEDQEVVNKVDKLKIKTGGGF